MADKTRPNGRTRDARSSGAGGSDGLMAFNSESGSTDGGVAPASGDADAPVTPARRTLRSWLSWSLLAILAATATTSLVALGPIRIQMPRQPAGATGTGRVTFETVPPGIDVTVDGVPRGQTPLTIKLDPGPHEAVLRRGAEERHIPMDLDARAEVVHRIEFAAPLPASLSKLTILTEPAGARVVVDGDWRGVSPVTVQDLSAGRHRIVVSAGGVTADRTVTTEAGASTSVVFSLTGTAADASAGWLVIDSPFEVRAVEHNEVIGTNAAAKIMVAPGSHEFTFVNAALGYESRRRVDVGRTTTVKLDARVPVNINARPWAEVTVDGTTAGTTPIANLVLPLGTHRILFHHPELGDAQQDVVVTLNGPNRFAVDLMK